jgi:hypothetical protein
MHWTRRAGAVEMTGASVDLTRTSPVESPNASREKPSGPGPRSHGAVIQRSHAVMALGRSRPCESRIASR